MKSSSESDRSKDSEPNEYENEQMMKTRETLMKKQFKTPFERKLLLGLISRDYELDDDEEKSDEDTFH